VKAGGGILKMGENVKKTFIFFQNRRKFERYFFPKLEKTRKIFSPTFGENLRDIFSKNWTKLRTNFSKEEEIPSHPSPGSRHHCIYYDPIIMVYISEVSLL
jgi:hypothetical protein